MENQHKLIKGYRDLSQEEIDLMNKIKELASQVGEVVKQVVDSKRQAYNGEYTVEEILTVDEDDLKEADRLYDLLQWAEEGKRDLQVGFMKLIRSVAAPESF